MELITAARRFIMADETLGGLVGRRVYRHRLEEPVDQTGHAAIVVAQNGGWRQMRDTHREAPLLRLNVYADPTRGPAGTYDVNDAEDKAYAIVRQLKRMLDPFANRGVWWGGGGSNRGLMVEQCQQWREPALLTEQDQQGTHVRLEALGESVRLTTDWALLIVPGT